jgi:ubiquinone/menaquinone biosynthesis C-methylase UbiE
MVRRIRLRELLVGVEGLALLRHLYDGNDVDAERRIHEVRRLLDEDEFSSMETMSEADPRSGYAAWSERYDDPGNLIIAIEEPVVWSLADELAPGRALDVACGTGRHARHLVDRGHDVVGIDYTPQMLRRAREAIAEALFIDADLRALPAPDESFDLVICGLALAHVANLDDAIAELGRVLRNGGHLILSVLHPFQAHLGWHAPFEDSNGERGFVREYAHTHADYLAAFERSGLTTCRCVEPKLSAHDLESKRRSYRHIPEATVAAYSGLPGVLVWDTRKG